MRRVRRAAPPSLDVLVVLAAKIIEKHGKRPDTLSSTRSWRDFADDLRFILSSAGASDAQLRSFASFLIDWIRSDHRLTTRQLSARVAVISDALGIERVH